MEKQHSFLKEENQGTAIGLHADKERASSRYFQTLLVLDKQKGIDVSELLRRNVGDWCGTGFKSLALSLTFHVSQNNSSPCFPSCKKG